MAVEITPAVVVTVATAAFLIGFSKGGLGGGLGPLITIVAALALPVSLAVGLLLPLLMVGDVVALWALRGRWDARRARALLPGAAGGVLVATLFLRSVSDREIEVFLGVFSLVFVAYRIAEPRLPIRELRAGRALGLVAGLTSGITSTVAHAGGPPAAIYLLAARVPPVTFVSTSALFFFAVNWLKVPGYAVAGVFDGELLLQLWPTALLIPPGVLAGRWVVHRVDKVVFERVVLALLAAGAVYLLVG